MPVTQKSLDLLQKCLNCHGSRSETSLRFLATLRFAQNDIHDFLTFARSLLIYVHSYCCTNVESFRRDFDLRMRFCLELRLHDNLWLDNACELEQLLYVNISISALILDKLWLGTWTTYGYSHNKYLKY
jgi:hypothetical protein